MDVVVGPIRVRVFIQQTVADGPLMPGTVPLTQAQSRLSLDPFPQAPGPQLPRLSPSR